MRNFELKTLNRAADIAFGIILIIGCLAFNCHALEPPIVTPVDTFFVQNNLGMPDIPDDWHLTVDGAVENPLSLTLDDLMGYPATTLMATLECYSSSIELIGNANWIGVSLTTIIEEALPLSGATTIGFHAQDGYITNRKSLPAMMQRDDIILAYAMNGQTLPLEQGYPLRLVVPGSYGYEWIQWIKRIELSTTPPVLDHLNPFPIHTKIFQPFNGETITVDIYTIYGMAFVGDGKEITQVEISTDGGTTWDAGQLLNYFVPNVWKHWVFTWVIPQGGEYQIFARAVDSEGTIQEENGLFGWRSLSKSITIDVCEGNFDCDSDVDGSDAAVFKSDFGRGGNNDPCSDGNPCNADFDCDANVDGTDAFLFKSNYGRSEYNSPCFSCPTDSWCVYPLDLQSSSDN